MAIYEVYDPVTEIRHIIEINSIQEAKDFFRDNLHKDFNWQDVVKRIVVTKVA